MNKFYPYQQFYEDGTIKLNDGGYCAAIQIFGFEFDLLDEEIQNEQIRILANFLRSQQNKITFLKLDLPFNFFSQKQFLQKLNKVINKKII